MKPTEMHLNLTYLSHVQLDHVGLSEPSGLAISSSGKSLWTISDDTKRVFKMNVKGKVRSSFRVSEKGLEDISLGPNGNLLMVKEEGNIILEVSPDSESIIHSKKLAEIDGYGSIEGYFASDDNNGLEGITWHTDSGSIFLLKEAQPGLLIELSTDLREIIGCKPLLEQNGFIDDRVTSADIDFSGICYDANQKAFWIVSDKARRIFLYDWESGQVQRSFSLGYGRKGKYREVKQAEGIAVDTKAGRVYVVSDQEARLYVFDLR